VVVAVVNISLDTSSFLLFTLGTTTAAVKDEDEEDSDHPPSEKKLKIDLENDNIKVKVTANDVKKVEKNDIKVKVTANDVKKVEKNDSSNNKSSSIKLKVMANDVKKVEKLAGNSNSNPIVKSEKKPEIVVQPSSVKKEEVIDRKKPIQTGINGTTANNSVKSTTATSPKSPIIHQESVVKPKLTNGSAAKSRDGNKKLYDIVNNLSKKQASLNNSPQQPGKKDSSIAVPAKPPASLLGGQTTITKKLLDDEKTKVKKVDRKSSEVVTKSIPTNVKESGSTKKRDNVKGIPSGTSVTVRSLPKSVTSSSQSPSSN
jgi:nicotinamide mononucleotide adenylyltransferase